MQVFRFIDPFTLVIVAAAILAGVAPPSREVAEALKPLTSIGVALVFFLHGARLSPTDVAKGLKQPRLHVATAALTYLAFPLLGLALYPLINLTLGPDLARGFIFLAALPSTVQSSVSFVAIAGGHVAAAVAAASLSNLVGVVLTPVILTLTLHMPDAASDKGMLDAVAKIGLIILLPFAIGQLSGRFLRPFLMQHRGSIGNVDRVVIAALVYQAVAQSVLGGVWDTLGVLPLLGVGGFSLVLLALVVTLSRLVAKALKLPREDAIVLSYCGSKKSLASGMPMLRVLYGDSPAAGTLALPIIIFHQLQLIVFSQLATRAGRLHAERAVQESP